MQENKHALLRQPTRSAGKQARVITLAYAKCRKTSTRYYVSLREVQENKHALLQYGSKKGYYTPISFVGHFTLWSIVTVSPTQTSNVGLGNCIPFGSDATLLDMYVHLCHK